MTDVFQFQGEFTSGPARGSDSGWAEALAPIAELLHLKLKQVGEYALVADAPVSVAFGGLASAHVLVLRSDGKVKAELTSADGTAQAVPVDPLLVLFAGRVPVTAVDLTRETGVDMTVRVFLGERDSVA